MCEYHKKKFGPNNSPSFRRSRKVWCRQASLRVETETNVSGEINRPRFQSTRKRFKNTLWRVPFYTCLLISQRVLLPLSFIDPQRTKSSLNFPTDMKEKKSSSFIEQFLSSSLM